MSKPQPDDGTRQLLQAGIWIIAVGVLAAVLAATVLGGIGRHGPHTNSGWIALIVAMGCVPFGLMAFALGAAKWLRNRRIAASRKHKTALPFKAVSPTGDSLLSFSEQSMEHPAHGKERQ